MNILVLSHIYPRPHDPSYGIFIHRQLQALVRLGHRLIVVSPVPWSPQVLHFNPKWQDYKHAPVSFDLDGIEIHYPRYLRLPGNWFRAVSGYTAYQAILPLVLRLHHQYKFEVIYSHTFLPDGLAGSYLGQKLNLPTICTSIGSDVILQPHENSLNLKYVKRVIRSTDQIVAISQAVKHKIEHLETPRRPVAVVYYGVDIEKFDKPDLDAVASSHQSTMMKPYILFVGRNIYIKGLKDLLAASAQLVDHIKYNLVVVGATLTEIKKLAPELTDLLAHRLIIAGVLSPDEIPEYMQNCEMFVLPSYSEGLSNVSLEAMACGKAVIATEVGALPEVVINGVTGILVQPGDVSSLTQAIQTLVNDPAKRLKMGKLGREYVANKFTWERNALELTAIFQESINNYY